MYTDTASCAHRGWECFFEPLSNCTEADVAPFEMVRCCCVVCKSDCSYTTQVQWSQDADASNARVFKVDWSNFADAERGIKVIYPHAHLFARLQEPFDGRSEAFLCAQLLRYVTRPNAYMRASLAALRQTIQFAPRSIGVFVANNDALERNGQSKQTVAAYMSLVSALAALHGIQSVFIATDDERLDLARIAQDYAQYQWSFQTTRRRALQSDTERAVRQLLDLYLLASCEHLVAPMSSEMARVAYALGRADNTVQSVRSLDTQDPAQWTTCFL